jgi:phage terminase large subunit-like protein
MGRWLGGRFLSDGKVAGAATGPGGDAASAAGLRLDDASVAALRGLTEAWSWRAHRGQLAPPGTWRTWLLMAGRGFGKTLAGSQWVHAQARALPTGRIALVGATHEDARRVMVDGASGLLATAAPDDAPKWNGSKSELLFASGARAFVYSAMSPEILRGPEHHFAWCDELGKWGARATDVWNNLSMGLRLGEAPRVVVTTTPRAMELLHRLRRDAGTTEGNGSTRDNPHLPEQFLADVVGQFGGTRLGRQELDGEMLQDAEHTLFPREMLEKSRIEAVLPDDLAIGQWQRLVIGVDPPVTSGGDACGIVLCGLRADGRICVLDDSSVVRPSPDVWANAVIACFRRWPVDRIIVENNQGGELVTRLLSDIDRSLPVTGEHTRIGKIGRAEPVAALFERGRGSLAGKFPDLEDQLNGLIMGMGYTGPGRSPDRADAMVYACNALMAGASRPAIRSLSN